MRACLRALGIIIIVLAALPFVVAQGPAKKNADAKPDVKDEVKKSDKTAKKKEKEKDEDLEKKGAKKEKLVYGANFTAKLKEMDSNSQKDFTVEIKIPVPNPDGIQALINAQNGWRQRQFQIAQNRNFQQRAQQAAQLQYDIQRDYPKLQANTRKLESKNVKVKAAENMRVRTMVLPIDYDDKGNVKKYTKKELEALRGKDKKLPGYTAEYEALHAGQIVHVYLARNQPNPAKAKGAKAGGDGGIKLNPDDDAGAIGERRPEVVMIVILAEPKER